MNTFIKFLELRSTLVLNSIKSIKLSNVQSTFFSIFLLLLPKAFMGFDITDLGFHLYNQKMAFEQGLDYLHVMPFFFLSCFLGGLWQCATEPIGLIGVYLGGILSYSFCGAMIAYIFQNHCKNFKPVFLSILFSAVIIAYYNGPNVYLHYYTIPMLLSTLYLLSCVVLYRNPSRKKSILLGFSTVLMVCVRFTSLPLLIIPPLSLLLSKHPKRRSYLTLFLLSFIFSLVISFLVIEYTNPAFIDSFKFYFTQDEQLSLFQILLLYTKQLWMGLKYLCVGVLVALPLFFFKTNLGYTFFSLYLAAFSLFSILSCFKFHYSVEPQFALCNKIASIFYDFDAYSDSTIILPLTFVLLTLIFGITWLLKAKVESHKKNEMILLLISSLILPFSIGAGSMSGLIKTLFGFWVIFALVPIFTSSFPKVQQVIIYNLKAFTLLFTIALCLSSYRDVPLKKMALFTQSPLRGIITHRSRQKIVTELMLEVSRRVNKGDRIIAYPYIPGIHYITNTTSQFTFCWPTLSEKLTTREIEELPKKPPPKLMVKPKFYGFLPRWPLHENYTLDIVSNLEEAIDHYTFDYYSPQLVWENEGFKIYTIHEKIKQQ